MHFLAIVPILSTVFLQGDLDARIADCISKVREEPRAKASCLTEMVSESEEARRKVRSAFGLLNKELPNNAWLLYSWGEAELGRNEQRASSLYRRSGEIFAKAGDDREAARAFFDLASVLRNQGLLEESYRALEQAKMYAIAANDETLLLQFRFEQATALRLRGLLNEAEGTIDELLDDLGLNSSERRPYSFLSFNALNEASRTAQALGRDEVALALRKRLLEMARQSGRPRANAIALTALSIIRLEMYSHPSDLDEIRTLLAEAIRISKARGFTTLEIQNRQRLGQIVGSANGRAELERAVELSGSNPRLRLTALLSLAELLASSNPEACRSILDEAFDIEIQSSTNLAHALLRVMRISWLVEEREEAMRRSLLALTTIEDLRSRQSNSGSRMEVFSYWVVAFNWLSGKLLDIEGSAASNAKAAFLLSERTRARALRERLADLQIPERSPQRMKPVKLKTLFADVGAPVKTGSTPLEQIEDDRDLEGGFVSVDEIKRALAPNEAFLFFQIGLWKSVYGMFDGGAWLLSVTSAGLHVYRLPDRYALENKVSLLLYFMERGELPADSWPTLYRLYEELVEQALDELPDGINRLIVASSSDLKQIPLSVLRPDEGSPPLGSRYQFSLVPSATLWLRWRALPETAPHHQILVFADPELPSSEQVSTKVRAWRRQHLPKLRLLPQAQWEGEVATIYAGAGLLRTGSEASESFAKNVDLSSYGIIHFAAHAVSDSNSENSAIVLAPGSKSEDGLLMPDEIAQLKLDGQIVILSVCNGASGTLMRGEGVMSLARAFLEAGARSVIGTLWKVRDGDAADVVEAFYRHLVTGISVGDALSTAQRERMRKGMPESSWAGFVVIGDADYVPFPASWINASTVLFLLAGMLGLGAIALHLGRQRTRQGTMPE